MRKMAEQAVVLAVLVLLLLFGLARAAPVCNYDSPWYHGGVMTTKGSLDAAVVALTNLTKLVLKNHPGALMYHFATGEGNTFSFHELWASDDDWLDHIYVRGTHQLRYPEAFAALGNAVDITGTVYGPCHLQDLYDWFAKFGGFSYCTNATGFMWQYSQ